MSVYYVCYLLILTGLNACLTDSTTCLLQHRSSHAFASAGPTVLILVSPTVALRWV